MEKRPLVALTWHGHETVAAIPEMLEVTERIEVVLPADYNHALFRALHPRASSSDLEQLDVRGGPELLAQMARVNGLQELEILIDALHAARAQVQIVSPPMLVIEVNAARPAQ
ncbi:MAG: hypothetical protein RQ736_00005 [Thiogranum sp.]|nr:hypothetical protein [Thiogranum sp.]